MRVMPIVVGALKTVSKAFDQRFEQLEIWKRIVTILSKGLLKSAKRLDINQTHIKDND